MNYIARTLEPSTIAPALREFDELILSALCQKNGIDRASLTDAAVRQIHLPVRNGGLGLRPLESIANAASYAALTHSIQDLTELRHEYINRTQREPPFSNRIAATINGLAQAGVPPSQCLPDPTAMAEIWNTFAEGSVPELQAYLTAEIELIEVDNLMNAASPQDKARLNSASAFGASRWLTTLPTERIFMLSNRQFSLAIHHLLALRIRDLPSLCVCGTQLNGDPSHFHCCAQTRRIAVTARHDAVAGVLWRVAREAGYIVEAETSFAGLIDDGTDDPHSLRPDGRIVGFGRYHMVEVSVVHPTAPSHVNDAQRCLAVARSMEQRKRTKYAELARRERASMSPFVLESFGAVGPSAHALLYELATDAEEDGGVSRGAFMSRAMTALSVAVQTGNAHIIASGVISARAAAARVRGHAPRSSLSS
jgi:hypothetical protein